jgi:formylglycine-generating enzyme required for sulfatase activity
LLKEISTGANDSIRARNPAPSGNWAKKRKLMLTGGSVLISLAVFAGIFNRQLVKDDQAQEQSQPAAAVTEGWQGWPADAPEPAIAPFSGEVARKHQGAWAAYLKVPMQFTNSLGMKFILIPPGEFTMGSTATEIEETIKAGYNDKNWHESVRSEAPRHKVVLTQPIYVGIHEVTQKVYETVMGKNPSYFAKSGPKADRVEKVTGLDTENHPVEGVSWQDATEFCAALSEREHLKPSYTGASRALDGSGYRLPTEAEWEFASRAGTTTKFWIGDTEADLLRAGWFQSNSGGRTHAAGERKANPFGLFDTLGNVMEWVQDWWEPAYYGRSLEMPAVNPSGPSIAGSQRVMRGGCWFHWAVAGRSSSREAFGPYDQADSIGFRVAIAPAGLNVNSKTMMPSEATPVPSGKDATTPAKVGRHAWPVDAPRPAIAPFNAEQARKRQQEWAEYLKLAVDFTNSIGMKFVLIPPGEFTMGSTTAEVEEALKHTSADKDEHQHFRSCVRSESPQHQVILTQPIYLGIHEVTQKQFETVIGRNPSYFASTGPEPSHAEKVAGLDTASHPVEGVSWNDAAEFCAKLCQQEGLKPFYVRAAEAMIPLEGTGYRLPTEAEWEFACRAGTTTKSWAGDRDDDLFRAGWVATNSGSRTHGAGEREANPFGLFDTHGNVCEWVADWWEPIYYGQLSGGPALNPRGAISGFEHVIRGGVWFGHASHCRSSSRDAFGAGPGLDSMGFRVALPVVSRRATR